MSKATEYQGWSNWHTWNANLWLTNTYEVYLSMKETESASDVRLLFLATFDNGSNCFDEIDYGCVNWYEIFNNFNME